MKKRFVAVFVCAGISAAGLVYAVGSGGGGSSGSTQTCNDDTYTCGEWTDCSLEGVQTRACDLTDDCEYVVDDPPSQSRACEPVCRSDGWTCGEWSDCTDGEQTRTCSLWYDCPLVEDPSPQASRTCAQAQTSEPSSSVVETVPEIFVVEAHVEVETADEPESPIVIESKEVKPSDSLEQTETPETNEPAASVEMKKRLSNFLFDWRFLLTLVWLAFLH